MYRVTYKGTLKPIFNKAVVDSGDGWFLVDPMRYPRYAAGVEAKRQKQAKIQERRVEASRSYLFRPGQTVQAQIKKRPTQPKKRPSSRKQTMHSKQRFMHASVMADTPPQEAPTAGELIQPLRGREWTSEFSVPLAQAAITGVLVMAGAGIVLAVSYELLDTVRAGLLEFSVIGGAAWLIGFARRVRYYDVIDALTEALPVGFLFGIGTAVYYLVVTGSWFSFWWGAAIAGVFGFAGLAFQWAKFLGKSDDLLYAIERMMAVDLDGDGEIGRLPVEPNGVRRIPGTRGGKPYDEEMDNQLPVNSHVMRSFAISVLCDKCNVSRTAICDHTKQDAYRWDKISQGDYSKLYDYLRKGRMIKEDTNELTAAGWDELSRWIPENFQPNLDRPTL